MTSLRLGRVLRATFCGALVTATVACSSDTPADGEHPSGGSASGTGAAGVGSGGRSGGGGAPGGAGSPAAGGAKGGSATGGSPAGGSAGASAAGLGCDSPDLSWKSAHKTNFTSYPDPGSEECIAYNGCMWAGQFAACSGKKPEAWVEAHDIVAAFPDFQTLELHDLCLRSGNKRIVVTVLDTCADSDCDGCCTQNQGDADQLIDLENYTNARWGVEDGSIEWADLGPTRGDGCD